MRFRFITRPQTNSTNSSVCKFSTSWLRTDRRTSTFDSIALLLLFASLGCTPATDTPAEPPELARHEPLRENDKRHPEATVATQLAAGRSGQSDRLEFRATVIDDRAFEAIGGKDTWLKTVIADRGKVTDEGLKSIAALPHLTHLRLRQSPISDVGMRLLAEAPKLQILNLPQCDATAEGVASLASLESLRNLRLGGTRLTAETAPAIGQLKSLRALHLIGVPIDDAGLREIAALPHLRSLYLDDAKVSDDGWTWFQENHPQIHVHVNQRHLDRSIPDHDQPD